MNQKTRALVLGLLAVVAACDTTGPGQSAVSITAISPEVLAPGVTAVIQGTGFATTPSGNEVSIAGVVVPVAAASAQELTIELPAEAFPCAAGGTATVTVTVDQQSASRDHPIEPPPARALDVGEQLVLHNGARCVELTEAGRYILSVFNTNTQPSATTAFRLRGVGAGGTAAAVAGAPLDRVLTTMARTADPEHKTKAKHGRILDANIALLQRLGPSGVARSSTYGTRSLQPTAVPQVGETRSFRIPDMDAENLCSSYKEVTARVVYSGSKGVIYEDTTAPLAGNMEMAERWAGVGQEFDEVMYPVIEQYFGDPLIKDAVLDANERVLMLFSEEVNDFEGNIAGFVFSGDLFQRSQCASSNTGEIFYGIVPTTTGTSYSDTGTLNGWHRAMRSTVIHELKHIVSFATRDALNRPFEETWLEEATARVAEELYAREMFGYGQNGNTTYQQSIYCEVRPTVSSCLGSPAVMIKHFDSGVTPWYRSMETLTPLGRVDDEDFTWYGTGWLLVRWAIDNSGVDEASFLRSLTSSSLTGVSNLAARAGRSFDEMLPDFTLATALDDRTGFAAQPWLSFPSWNTRDVYQGLHNDFSSQGYPTPFPLNLHQVSYGAFDVEVETLRSGTGSLFELSGSMQGSQTVQLLSAAGGVAPAALGLALVRVQ